MLMHDEPIVDLAHLGHLEILTPKPEESLRFFVDVMGMTESGRGLSRCPRFVYM
jgi:catechol 2,3-dioxygenase